MNTIQRTIGALLALSSSAAFAWPQDNVLVIVVDDAGVERVAAYGEHPSPGNTPNIDGLADRGVLFRNVWTTPFCSPSRACLLTGRCGFRTGIGQVVTSALMVPGLSLDEITIPEMLSAGTSGAYSSAAVGKWHVGSWDQGPLHAISSGFEVHAGSRFKLTSEAPGQNCFRWNKTINGQTQVRDYYATTDTVDDALRATRALGEPWLLWVAFNAPHKPYHAPPSALHTRSLAGDPNASPVEHHKAMTEAVDTELGRLLAGIDPDVLARTMIVFIADNGTQMDATEAPFVPNHGKGSIYEGGINVPMIVAGPEVAQQGSQCDGLVHATDLFATVADWTGVTLSTVMPAGRTLDSVSFAPYLGAPQTPSLRPVVYSELFRPNGPGPYTHYTRAVRDGRYKYIHREHVDQDELFDLQADPFEINNLLLGPLTPEQSTAHAILSSAMDRIIRS